MILVLLAVASVFSLIAIKWHGFSKTGNNLFQNEAYFEFIMIITLTHEIMVVCKIDVKHIFSDNGIPSSGSWIGITHSQTN